MTACWTRLLLLATLVASSSTLLGCITPTVRRDELRRLDSVALVSVHARRDIGLQDAQLGPMFTMNTVGEEVIDISLATIEGDVETLFGAGRVLPPSRAMQSKKYDLVPEALPAEEWTQAQKMLAVDVDHPRTPEALGVLAKDLGVNAVVVIRHEWSLSRDTYNRSFMVWAWDRCTILVVDDTGAVVWRETATARQPLQMAWANPFAVMGINGTVQIDQTRALARETAREAWRDLTRSFYEVPAGAALSPAQEPAGIEPPPPLATTPPTPTVQQTTPASPTTTTPTPESLPQDEPLPPQSLGPPALIETPPGVQP